MTTRKEQASADDGYYDTIAAGYNELHGEEQLKKYRIIADTLKLPRDAEVLDVGAGTGVGFAIIPNLGVDPSIELIKQHPNKESFVARAEELPFSDNSFDAALCVSAIHHTNYQRAIAEMLRVSRGPIAITVLRKSPKANAIVEYCIAALKPLRILNEEKDYILIHERKIK